MQVSKKKGRRRKEGRKLMCRRKQDKTSIPTCSLSSTPVMHSSSRFSSRDCMTLAIRAPLSATLNLACLYRACQVV